MQTDILGLILPPTPNERLTKSLDAPNKLPINPTQAARYLNIDAEDIRELI